MQKKPIQKNQKLDVWFEWYGLAAVPAKGKTKWIFKAMLGHLTVPYFTSI